MGETVPVEIVEVDGPDDPYPAAAGGPHEEATESPGRARGRRLGAVLAAVVVLGLLGAGGLAELLDERAAQARRDRLEAVGWPLVDLDEPLTEAWRADGGWFVVEGDGVVVVQGTGSRPAYRGLDEATGAVVWEIAAQGDEWCQPWYPDLPRGGSVDVLTLGRLGTPTTLVCAPSTGWDGSEVSPDAQSRLRVLDLATGSVVGAATVPGRVIGYDMTTDAAIVVTVRAEGTLAVTRVDLPSGEVAWDVVTEVGAGDDGLWAYPSFSPDTVQLTDAEGIVVATLDLETGALDEDGTGEQAGAAESTRAVWPDGSTLSVRTSAADGAVSPEIVVSGPDGAERFSFVGDPWVPPLWDGSLADRILVATREQDRRYLSALDIETGEELWSTVLEDRADAGGYGFYGAWAMVDGVLLSGEVELTATDARSGEVLWTHPVAGSFGLSLVTDGTRLLVPVVESDPLRRSLTALDLRSGTEAWRMPIEATDLSVQPLRGGVLLGTGGSGLIAYR